MTSTQDDAPLADQHPLADENESIASMEALLRQWDMILAGYSKSGTPEAKGEAYSDTSHLPTSYESQELIPIVTPIALEVSSQLTPFVDSSTEAGNKFLNEMLPLMKEGLFYELGVRFPGVRVRGFCSHLPDDTYIIKLNEVPVAVGQVELGKVLINESPEQLLMMKIEGEPTSNPANGMDASWIPIDKKDLVEQTGYTTWDTPGYIILHLSGVLRRFAYEFVGIQEVRGYLDTLSSAFPALIQEVCPGLLSLPQLTEILRRLVEEEISICDLKGILEALVEWAQVERDLVMLTEYVRMSMKRYITYKYSHGGSKLLVYLLDPQIEQAIQEAIEITDKGSYLTLAPEIADDILDAVRAEIGDLETTAQEPVVLTDVEIRRYFRQLAKLAFPNLRVLSFQELNPDMVVQPIARISVLREKPGEAKQEEPVLPTVAAPPVQESLPIRPAAKSWWRRWLGRLHPLGPRTKEQEVTSAGVLSDEVEEAAKQAQAAKAAKEKKEEREAREAHLARMLEEVQQKRKGQEGSQRKAELPVMEPAPYVTQWEYIEERLHWLKMHLTICHHKRQRATSSFWWRRHELRPFTQQGESWHTKEAVTLEQLKAMEQLKEHLMTRIQARARETAKQGGELALERMRRTFHLTPLDEEILLLLLMSSLDPSSSLFHLNMNPAPRRFDMFTIQLASWLLASDARGQNEVMQRLSPKSPLQKHQLVEHHSPYHRNPLHEDTLCLAPDVLFSLTADTVLEEEEVLLLPEEQLQALSLPDDLREQLQQLLARFLAEQGPGLAHIEDEPLESLYVYGTSEQADPSWQELFAHGLVFLLRGHEELATEKLARHMSHSIRRKLIPLSLPLDQSIDEGVFGQLKASFRQARMERECLYIDGTVTIQVQKAVARRIQLEEEISSFPGVVFLPNWDDEPPLSWHQKVVLSLTYQDEKWTLSQQVGPRALGQVKRAGLEGLEELLSLRIVGQQSALQRISHVVRTAKARLDARPERPDGVFLLAGPSGSGKTQTALALTDALYNDPTRLLRIDMSELHFREAVSSLIGTTPGWIGYEQGGRLTNFVRKYPESVVLLDEIEKSHPTALDVFLQVFDAGRLTDGQGKTIDCSRVTFLATTNIGAETFHKQGKVGFVKEVDREQEVEIVLRQLRKKLRPEFLNRFDEILVFFPLDVGQMQQICRRQLRQLQERFARRGIWLEIAPQVAPHIVAIAATNEGARGIQRAIERQLSQPLTTFLLAHQEAHHLQVILKENELLIRSGDKTGA